MQATRQQILDFLRQHGEANVRDLGAHLRLTATGVRQHLAILDRDGLVVSRDIRGRIGRPALSYRLTDRAEALYPKAYDRLALAMISSARRRLDDADFIALIEDAALLLARPHRAQVGEGPPEARLDALCEVLRDQEIVVDYTTCEGGFLLEQKTCPFHDAAEASPATCDLDTALLGAMTGLPVELVHSRAHGGGSRTDGDGTRDEGCTFLVRTAPNTADHRPGARREPEPLDLGRTPSR
jgi:predicted ArsR family transcriptional regulator